MGGQEEGEKGGEKNNHLQTHRRKMHHRKRGLAESNLLTVVNFSSSPPSKGHFVMNFTASCVSCGQGSGQW